MTKIAINSEYITLGQFLKFINVISNGGQAKLYLLNNKVFVNDELETRRGRKLRNNDVVSFTDKQYIIVQD